MLYTVNHDIQRSTYGSLAPSLETSGQDLVTIFFRKGPFWYEKFSDFPIKKTHTYRNTFNTRMVAGELTTRSSISFMVDCSNVSSRGLLEADVAMANAAAAVDVLLLR